jgi:nitrous oxidase accessory protein NosD
LPDPRADRERPRRAQRTANISEVVIERTPLAGNISYAQQKWGRYGETAALAILALTVNVIQTEPAPLEAAARTLVVDAEGSAEYATIGDAVAAAADGDTIAILPGEYVEALIVDKDITLTGDGPREEIVITAPADAPRYALVDAPTTEITFALAFHGADAEVSGITLRGEDTRLVVDGSRLQVLDSGFEDTGETCQGSLTIGGLVAMGASDVVIRGNQFSGGGGPFITDGTRATIDANAFLDGPEVAGAFPSGSEIRDNIFTSDSDVGISVLARSDVVIADNTTRDRYNAIRTYASAGDIFTGEIRDNTISGASTGISVYTLDGARIADNTIRDGRVGIQLDGSEALVSGNDVTGQKTAIGIFGGAPVLEGNVLVGNEAGLSVAGGATPTLSGNLICGNETDVASIDGLDLSANEACDTVAME